MYCKEDISLGKAQKCSKLDCEHKNVEASALKCKAEKHRKFERQETQSLKHQFLG